MPKTEDKIVIKHNHLTYRQTVICRYEFNVFERFCSFLRVTKKYTSLLNGKFKQTVIIMKKLEKTAGRDLIRLIPCLTENQILDLKQMACVKGGDGDGVPIIILPPK